MITFISYADAARCTAQYNGINSFRGVVYNSLKMSGEAGEISDKVGKIFGRGEEPTPAQIEDLKKEAGDVLWHLTNLCMDLGLYLDDVAKTNIEKLKSRQERGVIDGHGDNR